MKKCKNCNHETEETICTNCQFPIALDERMHEIRFSYSNLSTFQTCKYAWYLTYVKKVERLGNFYSDYGLLIHHIMEEFFRGNLEAIELEDKYEELFYDFIKNAPPPFVKINDYYEQGKDFFKYFSVNRDEYEILMIEGMVDVDGKEKIVVKPDLVIREKLSGKTILVDYKSSLIYKKEKLDEEKLEGYVKQMTMYSLFLKEIGIFIDEVWLLFIREKEPQRIIRKIIPDDLTLDKTSNWVYNTVNKIKQERVFEPNVDKFFCKHLCSVKNHCKFYAG